VGVVYKLVEDASGPKVKLATDKVTLPGRKQVFRLVEGSHAQADVLGLYDEVVEGGRPVLERVMVDGKRIADQEPLTALRDRCRDAVASLPPRVRALEPNGPPYDVRISPALDALVHELHAKLGAP
jgi:nicotinate phosphoribosyltransferase